jgi:carbon-monoxide dehydrogenase medium subunit
LRPGEIAVEVRVPPPRGTRSGRYLKLERRVGDFATVGVAVALELMGDTVIKAGIALTGVGPTNIKARAAEDVLIGSTVDSATVAEAARLAAEAAQPRSDHRGSAAYKRQVVRTFVIRALSAPAAKVA